MKVTEDTKRVARGVLEYWALTGEHDQEQWVGSDVPKITNVTIGVKKYKVCDSTMCAAGTAVFLNTSKKKFKDLAAERFSDDYEWTRRAAKLLGLTSREADKIFYSDNDSALVLMTFLAVGNKDAFHKYDAVEI